MMDARDRMAAQGQTPPPLLSGALPIYGSDGNRNAFEAMHQAGQQIQTVSLWALTAIALVPGAGPLVAAGTAIGLLIGGDVRGAIMSILTSAILGKVLGLGARLGGGIGNRAPSLARRFARSFSGRRPALPPSPVSRPTTVVPTVRPTSPTTVRPVTAPPARPVTPAPGSNPVVRPVRPAGPAPAPVRPGAQGPGATPRARVPLQVAGQPNCFAAGTPMLTPEGEKLIEELRRGDLVLSRSQDDVCGPVEAKPVEAVFVRVAPLWELGVGGRVIRVTGEHPFYVCGGGWRQLKELQPGDLLHSHDGQWVRVEKLTETGEVATVYNVCVG